jgi:hypothetical protein
MDTLENGAGYCRHLTDESLLRDELLARLTRPAHPFRQTLADHAPNCDGSCYDCLRHYDNAELHGLLDWRLGLDLAGLFADSSTDVGLHLPHWQTLAAKAADRLARTLNHATAGEFDGLPVVRAGGKLRAVLAHPLWSEDHPVLVRLRQRLGKQKLPLASPFDVFRRPGWVIAHLARPVAATAEAPPSPPPRIDVPRVSLSEAATAVSLPPVFDLVYPRDNLSALVPAGGTLRVRLLTADDPLPDKGSVVVVRDATLAHSDGASGIAAGAFRWSPREDENGVLDHVAVTLRPQTGNPGGRTVQLNVPMVDWPRFRPLAVHVPREG